MLLVDTLDPTRPLYLTVKCSPIQKGTGLLGAPSELVRRLQDDAGTGNPSLIQHCCLYEFSRSLTLTSLRDKLI